MIAAIRRFIYHAALDLLGSNFVVTGVEWITRQRARWRARGIPKAGSKKEVQE